MSFLAQIAVALGVLQLLLGRKEWYIDIIGYLAVGTEAMLPVPQVLTNYRRKSVEGFR
jgi:presenilin-like A22 family membrane protease